MKQEGSVGGTCGGVLQLQRFPVDLRQAFVSVEKSSRCAAEHLDKRRETDVQGGARAYSMFGLVGLTFLLEGASTVEQEGSDQSYEETDKVGTASRHKKCRVCVLRALVRRQPGEGEGEGRWDPI